MTMLEKLEAATRKVAAQKRLSYAEAYRRILLLNLQHSWMRSLSQH